MLLGTFTLVSCASRFLSDIVQRVVHDATADEQVTGGQVEVKLSYGEVPLFHQLIDLCKLLEQVNITCPVKVGPVNNVLVKTKIPQEAPSVSLSNSGVAAILLADSFFQGNYIGSAIMNDKNKQQLVCIELNFKL